MTTDHTDHDLATAEYVARIADTNAEHFTDVARTLDAQSRTTLATHYYNLADAYEALAAARRREAATEPHKSAHVSRMNAARELEGR